MKKTFTLLILLTLSVLQMQAAHLSSSLQVTARCNAMNEVPAVTADGLGLAIITINSDRSSGELYFQATGMSGAITGIHIHKGQPDESGPVVMNLTPFLTNNYVRATIGNTLDFSIASLLKGEYYLNVHTDLNPAGEIRGQLKLETDILFAGPLTGGNEVPPVIGDGLGYAIANLSSAGDSLKIIAFFESTSDIATAAHLHLGAPGTAGAVIADLTSAISINGTIDICVDATAFKDDLINGLVYLNIHTALNPAGELRANLVRSSNLAFDCLLNGTQEVPALATNARGLVAIEYDLQANIINLSGFISTTSSLITGAHLHMGGPGNNGGVIVDLSSSVTNGLFVGTIENPEADLINAMLSGGVYLNVHTEDNPSGEIRGQVYKLAREGYFANMNGGQEVPPVMTNASGVIMASIDRNQTNAHVMMVVDGLESDFAGAHLHSGAANTNGGVIFDLSPFYNLGGVFTYWKNLEANVALFRTTGVYGNVHTTGNPGGEARGNMIRGSNFNNVQIFNPDFSGRLLFTGRMTSSQEVPPSASNQTGVCGILLNETRDRAYINLSVTGLEGKFSGVHLHNAAPGENGAVIFNLTDFYYKNRISTEIPVSEELLEALMAGEIYVNIHSDIYPGGELRAQLPLEQDISYATFLDGDQEVPAVTTPAVGFATIHLTQVLNQGEINAMFSGLSGPITGAHLHTGQIGENGGVAVDLSGLVNGMRLEGTFDASQIINDLNNQNIYLNIHTGNHPGGEIRGQVFAASGITLDGFMSGAQEVPSNTSQASGFAIANYSESGEFSVFVLTNNLSGPITGAHIHRAPQGATGGVIADLSSGIDGNIINVPSLSIDEETFSALIKGEAYVNVHTAAYPAGEIRTQLYSLIRDGYVYDMCPAQEVDMVVGAPLATGGGIASLDRKNNNIHLMAVTSGTSDTLTGLHIHNAALGSAGGVILNLTDLEQNGAAFLYYTEDGFRDNIGTVIRNGEAYLNAHTTMNPGGELRGQIVMESICDERLEITDIEYRDPGFSSDILIASRLSGGNEVPQVVTSGIGVATVTLDATMRKGTLNLTASNLSSEVTGVHIHDGTAGMNGGVLINFTDDYKSGRLTADFDIDQELLDKLIKAQVYLNVHTVDNPSGEIRGQLGLEAANSYSGLLSGDQEVPALMVDGNGIASLHYTAFTNELEINIQASRLSGPIVGIHLHKAIEGESGPVVEDLTPYLIGNSVKTKIQAGDYINALNMDSIYVNIHTVNNPSGEIRGQVYSTNSMIIDSWLSGSQEVPAVDGNSIGLGLFELDLAASTMNFTIVTDNLTGTATGAHLHQAALGDNGGVVVDLSNGIEENMISGIDIPLDESLISNLLSGMIYTNVHTDLFPGGEIRGQLYRIAREGYAYDLCQSQQSSTPVNAGDASGSGMFAYNRDMDEAHLMVVANELSSDFEGAHIHNGAEGEDGGVILNFSDLFSNNGAFFYFTDDSDTAFNAEFAAIVNSGNGYVNIHTSNNPAGEIRGQIVKTPQCPFSTATIEINDGSIELEVYPNPTQDKVYFRLQNDAKLNLQTIDISVMDYQGRVLKTLRQFDFNNGVNLTDIANGIYYLRLSSDEFTHTFKLIKT